MDITDYLAQKDQLVQLVVLLLEVWGPKEWRDIQEAGEEATEDQRESQESLDYQVCLQQQRAHTNSCLHAL